MYQNTLSFANGQFDEFINSIFLRLHCHFSSLTMRENNLVLRIHPTEIKIANPYAFPMIRYFLARTIYYMRHLVCNHKFQVLHTQFLIQSHLAYRCSKVISAAAHPALGSNKIFEWPGAPARAPPPAADALVTPPAAINFLRSFTLTAAAGPTLAAS